MNNLNLLDSLIANQAIALQQEANNWEEAIDLALQPLIKAKMIDQGYGKAIIESTKKFGPYYLIDEKIAMPHAQPSSLIHQNCFSLLTLKKPIYFLNDTRPIQVLICLAATSSDIHVTKALPQIVAVFENKNTQTEIINATSVEQVISIIKNVNLNKYL